MSNTLGRETAAPPKPNRILWAPFRALASVATFGGEFLVHPGPMGTPVPSMPALGRRMAAHVPPRPPGYIVELGAGTGAVTAALLKRVDSPETLISVDCSPAMARRLKERYPHLRIVVGSAARLGALLTEQLGLTEKRLPVSHVVSSLPLRSLPKTEVAEIVREIKAVLPPEGRFIQYTYDLRPMPHPALRQFRLLHSSIVWVNLPPARVSVYSV